MADSNRHKVFISYGSADREWALAFAGCLKAKHPSTSWPEQPIDADQTLVEQARGDLYDSEILVVVLGRDKARAAPWVRFEWGAAVGTEKRLLVISPRGSNIEAGELPLHARAMNFFVKAAPEQTAEEVSVELQRQAEGELGHKKP